MKTLLNKSIKESISEYAAQAEEIGALHPAILDLAYTHNWFKLFVPEIYGGG
jgi:hypothetical protein